MRDTLTGKPIFDDPYKPRGKSENICQRINFVFIIDYLIGER